MVGEDKRLTITKLTGYNSSMPTLDLFPQAPDRVQCTALCRHQAYWLLSHTRWMEIAQGGQ